MKRFGILALVSWLAGCGGRVEDEPGQHVGPAASTSPEPCLPSLGKRPVAHACQHAKLGPFAQSVAAQDVTAAADVSRVHHTYEVVFASEELRRGALQFHTARAGQQALMHTAEVELVVRENGRVLPAISASVSGCEFFSRALVVNLQANTDYRIEAKAEARTFRTFVEYLEAFGDAIWDDVQPKCN